MSWFSVLKVDIDFSIRDYPDDPDSDGWYMSDYKDNKGKLGGNEHIVVKPNKTWEFLVEWAEEVNLVATEDELEEMLIADVIGTITHEAAHAAHDIIDPRFNERFASQKEYIAYALEYFKKPILKRLGVWLQHHRVKDTARARKVRNRILATKNLTQNTPDSEEKVYRILQQLTEKEVLEMIG